MFIIVLWYMVYLYMYIVWYTPTPTHISLVNIYENYKKKKFLKKCYVIRSLVSSHPFHLCYCCCKEMCIFISFRVAFCGRGLHYRYCFCRVYITNLVYVFQLKPINRPLSGIIGRPSCRNWARAAHAGIQYFYPIKPYLCWY